MTTRAADDFSFIRAKLRELEAAPIDPPKCSPALDWTSLPKGVWIDWNDNGKTPMPVPSELLVTVHLRDGSEHTDQAAQFLWDISSCAVDITAFMLYCPTCENGGWVLVHSNHPPAFDECPDCNNPGHFPSP